jgi:hypothetical protein
MSPATVASPASAVTASIFSDTSLLVTATLPTFDQQAVAACAAVKIASAADILNLFGNHSGFFDWYNATFKNIGAVASRYPCADTSLKQQRFAAFWNQVDVIFAKPEISALEFCALMAINLEESNGNLAAAAEEMNGLNRPHPGLAYAFDKIDGLKQSYNHAPNRSALSLFEDALFVRSHGTLPGGDAILHRAGGFVMEADFYKFRGRGIIQTTWRSDYELLIDWILSDEASANATLAALGQRWRSATSGLSGQQQLDAIATISTNQDWDLAFAEPVTLAKGVAIDSKNKANYLTCLGRTAAALGADRQTRGSLLYFAAHINGGSYPDRVAPIMKTLICGIAASLTGSPMARLSRDVES